MASLGDIEAQLADLKKRKLELSKELAAEKKKQKRAEDGGAHLARLLHKARVDQVAPKLRKDVLSELLLLLELAGAGNDVVVSFALGQGRPPMCRNHGFTDVWDTDLRATLSAGVDLMYLGAEPDFLLSYKTGCALSQFKMVSKYIVEYKLFKWMLEQNCKKGVAPDTSTLLVQACSYVPEQAPEDIRTWLNTYFTNGNSTSYQWAASFRERWGIGPGSLDTGEDLEPSLLQAKVPRFLLQVCLCVVAFLAHFFAFFVRFQVQFLVPFLAPKLGPRFGHFNRKCINWSKSGPSFGSHFGSHFWAPKSANFWLPGGFSWPKIWVPYLGALGLL